MSETSGDADESQTVLEYQSPAGAGKRRRLLSAGGGFLIGFAATPIAIFLAIVSAGAGHGDYVIARALFPIPIVISVAISWINTGIGSMTTSGILLAVLQFPVYGLMIGWSLGKQQIRWLIALLSVHLLGVAICFFGMMSVFS